MFCSQCGLQLAANIKICPRCRKVLAPTAQPIRPVYQQPTYQQPVYQQPVYQQPTYQQPVYQQPVYQQPVYQQPSYQQPMQQNFAAPAPQPQAAPAPVVEEPVAPVVEEPVAPVVEETVVSVVEEPTVPPVAPVDAAPATPTYTEPSASAPVDAAPATPAYTAPTASAPVAEPQPFVVPKQVNVPLGILGSLLGVLAGGVIWFLLGMAGIVAGLAGIVMIGLGLFLFKKLSGTENSLLGVIITVVLAILMILLAEYMVVAYTLVDQGVVSSFGEGLACAPDMIDYVPELGAAVGQDIAFGIVFGALGSVGMIIEEIRARKAAKNN